MITAILMSKEFKAIVEELPELATAEEIRRGDGTVVTGSEVLFCSENTDEVNARIVDSARRAIAEEKHLALVIENHCSIGTIGELLFLNPEKLLAGNP